MDNIQTPAPVAVFVKRCEELQNAAELSDALAVKLEHIERKLLGVRCETGSGSEKPELAGGSLNDDIQLYTSHINNALERLAKSIERLDKELEGVGIPPEGDPVDERPAENCGCPPFQTDGRL